jgi:hypothetical protein
VQADRSPIAEEGWFQVGRLGQFPVDHRLSEGEGAFALSSTTKQSSPTTLAVAIVTMVDRASVVAISCVVAPDRRSYLGKYVVIGTLRGSTPN